MRRLASGTLPLERRPGVGESGPLMLKRPAPAEAAPQPTGGRCALVGAGPPRWRAQRPWRRGWPSARRPP
jgi:hypothetical protein